MALSDDEGDGHGGGDGGSVDPAVSSGQPSPVNKSPTSLGSQGKGLSMKRANSLAKQVLSRDNSAVIVKSVRRGPWEEVRCRGGIAVVSCDGVTLSR